MSVVIFTGAVGTVIGDRSGAELAGSIPPTALTTTLLEQEREIRTLRLASFRPLARVEAVRYVPIQDWLDPAVPNPFFFRRLERPAQLAETAGHSQAY